MVNRFDVVIISAFERGVWLSRHLQESGLTVALIDVTAQMGVTRASYWEGPFGFFADSSLTISQMEFLNTQPVEELNRGFCLWLDSGPLEMRGAAHESRIKSLGLDVSAAHLLGHDSDANLAAIHNVLSKRKREDFGKHWLMALSMQISNVVFDPFHDFLSTGEMQPLAAPYYIRRFENDERIASLDWAQASQVKIYRSAKVKDVALTGRRVDGIEIQADTSGIIHGGQFVWCLTSEETKRVMPKSYDSLYSTPPAQPQWMWTNFVFEIEETDVTRFWPQRMLVIDELELPWTHENFLFLQKSKVPLRWDVWLRRPTNQRFQRSYLEDLAERIGGVLKKRSLDARVELKLMPLEIELDEPILGPARYPVFDVQELERLKPKKYKNLFLSSAEETRAHHWSTHLGFQHKLADRIVESWKKEQQKKGVEGDRAIHAP